ncbi:MAG: hypothetical protein K2X28_08060 [Alphaproteobacteria bacterium]|nr:hypothetical protein [Alphaproteobacteria bacterium]
MRLRELHTWMKPGIRSQKGFDLLGYHITPQGFSTNQKTQEKAFKNAKRRYAQGDMKSLQEDLKRWREWGHAGLPSKVHHVENIVASIAEKVTAGRRQSNSQSRTNCPTLSVFYGLNNFMKGISSCKINFSRHQR